ncbi:hypothetical protein J4210_05155 [Candidatus Woesearchaeota archaeon]|nr:hypothetical protein [Candidatus Woesearchaeota archaeon]
MRRGIVTLYVSLGLILSGCPDKGNDENKRAEMYAHLVCGNTASDLAVGLPPERNLSEEREDSNICLEPLPLSVQKYLAHVKTNGFAYARCSEPESHFDAYPGGYLEATKRGVCDEFALNAARHLLFADDLRHLVLVGYDGLLTKPLKKCDGSLTMMAGHAILAYQVENGTWGSICNGQAEEVDMMSLNELIMSSAEKHDFRALTTVEAIPRTVLVEKRSFLLEPSGGSISQELKALWGQYPFAVY